MTDLVRELLTACIVAKSPHDFVLTPNNKPVCDFRELGSKPVRLPVCRRCCFKICDDAQQEIWYALQRRKSSQCGLMTTWTRSVFDRYCIVVSETDLREAARKLETQSASKLTQVGQGLGRVALEEKDIRKSAPQDSLLAN